MKRFLVILVGVALVCALAYLAWLNPVQVDLRLSPTYVTQPPLAAALVLAFLVGAVSVLGTLMVRGAGRSVRGWWHRRGERRGARADTLEREGQTLLWEGQGDRGRALLLRAWRRDPSRRRAAQAAALSHLEDDDAAAAERVLRDALERHRGDPDLLLALSDARSRQGDHTGSIHALEQVRAQHPRAARVLTALRDRYAAAGRWAEAAAAQGEYHRALSRSASVERERQRLIGLQYEAAVALPAPGERVAALERLVDAHPTFIPGVVSLGDALTDGGRAADAISLWERVLRTTPRTILIERLLQSDADQDRRHHWQQQLGKARTSSVQSDCVLLWQARLRLLDRQPSEALQEIDALPTQLHGTALFHQVRAEALQQLGQLEEAVNEYAQSWREGSAALYICRSCDHNATTWVARCPQCAKWDSHRAPVEIAAD